MYIYIYIFFQMGWFNHQLENPVTQERITVPLCCVMRALLDAWRGSRHGCGHRWGFEAWGVEALKLATVLKHMKQLCIFIYINYM